MMKFLERISFKIFKDDIFTQAAALGLYTAFSFAPLVILLISFLSMMHLNLQNQLIEQVRALMGTEAAGVLQMIIEKSSSRKDLGGLSSWIGGATLLFSASVIFVQVQSSMNVIFASSSSQDDNLGFYQGVLSFFRRRLVSFGIVLSFIFISIVSLLFSAFLAAIAHYEMSYLAHILSGAMSILVFAGLFSIIFKWMPDTKISTSAALTGGVLTSILFICGKAMIGLYLGQTAFGSAYGAAGSIIVMLIWVYYSSLIIFLGAEVVSLLPEQKLSQEAL